MEEWNRCAVCFFRNTELGKNRVKEEELWKEDCGNRNRRRRVMGEDRSACLADTRKKLLPER